MSKKLRSIPDFADEAEERAFWETNDSTDFVDWGQARRVRFPHLKPTTTAISLRLPISLLEQIRIAANKRDIPYQSLIKTWLSEKVGQP
jgi:predicted DNA binding CopG/RHH family protein